MATGSVRLSPRLSIFAARRTLAVWIMIAAHVLRTILAAAFVWGAIFYDKPSAFGPAAVDRMFQVVSLKVLMLGAVALLFLVPWSQPRRYLKLLVPTIAWLIPTGTLLAYNYARDGQLFRLRQHEREHGIHLADVHRQVGRHGPADLRLQHVPDPAAGAGGALPDVSLELAGLLAVSFGSCRACCCTSRTTSASSVRECGTCGSSSRSSRPW